MDDMLTSNCLEYEPLMIYANCDDFPKSMSREEFLKVKDKPYRMCPSDDFTGKGAEDRTQWLADCMLTSDTATNR